MPHAALQYTSCQVKESLLRDAGRACLSFDPLAAHHRRTFERMTVFLADAKTV